MQDKDKGKEKVDDIQRNNRKESKLERLSNYWNNNLGSEVKRQFRPKHLLWNVLQLLMIAVFVVANIRVGGLSILETATITGASLSFSYLIEASNFTKYRKGLQKQLLP